MMQVYFTSCDAQDAYTKTLHEALCGENLYLALFAQVYTPCYLSYHVDEYKDCFLCPSRAATEMHSQLPLP